MGFGGAHLHPRTGLETPYLSDEFMELVKYADEQAREKGMLCWLYDEDRYPSGAAGGMVTENWNYRARHLLLTREKNRECALTGKNSFPVLRPGESRLVIICVHIGLRRKKDIFILITGYPGRSRILTARPQSKGKESCGLHMWS